MDPSHKRLQTAFKQYLRTQRAMQKSSSSTNPSPDPASNTSNVKEVKKRRTKQRQMSKENVPKVVPIEVEEAEEFEPAPEGASPALCLGKKKPKLYWKKEETDDKEEQLARDDIAEKSEKNEQKTPELKKSEENHLVAQIRHELERSKAAVAKQIEATQVDNEEMKKLMNQLRNPKWKKGDKTGVKARIRKKGSSDSQNEDELDEVTKTVALKTLDVLKKNQLLEKALDHRENLVLHNFFTGAKGKPPSEEVLKVLNKAMTMAIEKLINRPHELEDAIDNQMRQLLINQDIGKSVLLEVMLVQPQFIPISWGGKNENVMKEFVQNHKFVSALPSISLAGK